MRLNLHRVQAGGRCGVGVVGYRRRVSAEALNGVRGVSGRLLGWAGVVGETPVHENIANVVGWCSRVAASSWNLL